MQSTGANRAKGAEPPRSWQQVPPPSGIWFGDMGLFGAQKRTKMGTQIIGEFP